MCVRVCVWLIAHCHVWLPDRISREKTHGCPADFCRKNPIWGTARNRKARNAWFGTNARVDKCPVLVIVNTWKNMEKLSAGNYHCSLFGWCEKWASSMTFTNPRLVKKTQKSPFSRSHLDWFKGKSTGNHIDFPAKYGVFLWIFPWTNPLTVSPWYSAYVALRSMWRACPPTTNSSRRSWRTWSKLPCDYLAFSRWEHGESMI